MMRHIPVILALLLCQGCVTSERLPASNGKPSKVRVYYHPAKSQPAPTVLVSHGCSGVTAHHVAWASELNSWGYNAVVVDSFSGRGLASICDRTYMVAPTQMAADLVQVASEVQRKPWHKGKIGAIGFSHGGGAMIALTDRTRLQLWAADFLDVRAPNPIAAVVAYYPGCGSTGPPLKPDIPIMLHFGMKDDWTPPSSCGWYQGTENFLDPHYSVYAYPNATHTFDTARSPTTYAGHYLAYDPDADRASRQRTRDFFEKYLRH